MDPTALEELAKILAPILIEQGVGVLGRRRQTSRKTLDRALEYAFSQFSQHYPDLAASLFDDYFLKHTARPLFS